MKLSVEVLDQHLHSNPRDSFVIRAKIPVTVFGLPFVSGIAATDPSKISFSLRTNLASGPSLKLSYAPPSAIAAATAAYATQPLSLTLKSGVGLFGSPHNSPLVISACFTLSPNIPSPTFSLQFRPQFGDFFLRKTTTSTSSPTPKANGGVNSIGFVPLERPTVWKELTESFRLKDSVLSGASVRAVTALPLTKRVAVNLRWGVNFPADLGKELPFLSLNKIRVERIDEVKEGKEVKEVKDGRNNLEVLSGMYFWMRRELDVLQKENREMKHMLKEMKLGHSARTHQGDYNSVGKASPTVVGNSGGFEQWKSKKNDSEEDNGWNKSKKSLSRTSNVASEVERALKAASS